MHTLFIATSLALAFTMIFSFRFRVPLKDKKLWVYFAVAFAAELSAEYYILPPDMLSPAVGIVCLAIAAVFFAAQKFSEKLELRMQQEERTKIRTS